MALRANHGRKHDTGVRAEIAGFVAAEGVQSYMDNLTGRETRTALRDLRSLRPRVSYAEATLVNRSGTFAPIPA